MSVINSKDFSGIKVGVLAGGVSAERDISLISGEQAFLALKQNNIDVVMIDINTRDKKKITALIEDNKINFAFIALHGEFGEDGQIQTILEEIFLAYTGSGPQASQNAMDKVKAKEIFRLNGVPTPNFCVRHNLNESFDKINYPVVVKPAAVGSSIGISIVDKPGDLSSALAAAFSVQSKVLIEDYIAGREFTIGIFDDKALAVVEILPKTKFFDFQAKYSDGLVDFSAPAKLPVSLYELLRDTALRAHLALGCRDFSRADIRLNQEGVPYVLEVNSIPGLTTHSLLPLSAKCCGIDFTALILGMVELGLRRKNQK
jgi:D-alanine-D-alanine ligase